MRQQRLNINSALFIFFLGAALYVFCFAAHGQPAPGSRIENQASASFRGPSTGAVDEQLTSNRVVATLQGVSLLELTPNHERTAGPSNRVQFIHTLTNRGNLTDNVRLVLEHSNGENTSEDSLKALWLDINANGTVDTADQEITDGTQITLSPGQTRQLIVTTTVPADSQNNDNILLILNAEGRDNNITVTDLIVVLRTSNISMLWQSSVDNVLAQDDFFLGIKLGLDGDSLRGRPIIVDDQPTTMVTVSMPLPAGVFLAKATTPPPEYITLYREAGSLSNVYSTTPPTVLRDVANIAFAKTHITIEEAPTFTFPLNAIGDTREISLPVHVEYATSTFQSEAAVIQINANNETNEEDGRTGLWINQSKTTVDQPLIVRAGELTNLSFVCYACDSNSDQINTVNLDVISEKTDDSERLILTESSFRSGQFNYNNLQLVSQNDVPSISGDGRISVTKNNWLHFSVTLPDGQTLTQSLLVDPAGYVFDSVTGVPIVNAEVTMYRVGIGETLSLAAVFADAAGTQPVDNPTPTDVEGYYEFPFAAQGNYRLKVTRLAPGFSTPSTQSGAAMGDIATLYPNLSGFDDSGNLTSGVAITQAQGPSYTGVFTLENQAVYIDIPVDPDYLSSNIGDARGLALDVGTDRRSASVGEAINYAMTLKNKSGNRLPQAQIQVNLPRGFQLLPDSVRRDDKTSVPPQRQNNSLVFDVDNIDVEQSTVLSFRAVVTPRALGDNGVTLAKARATGILLPGRPAASYNSRYQRVKININAGVFNNDGVIIGKVFRDCDGDGRQHNGLVEEPGVAGVRIYLQNGRFVQTDAFGRYSFSRLRPSTYIVKADTSSTDVPWKLTRYTHLSGTHDSLIRADLSDGELFRADFPLAACATEVLPEKQTKTSNLAANINKISTPMQTTSLVPIDTPATQKPEKISVVIESPVNKARITRDQTAIKFRGPTDVTYELKVNNTLLSDDRLGSQSVDIGKATQYLEYFAIPLNPGSNTITAVARDRWGNERGRHSIEVRRPATLNQLTWVASEVPLLANSTEHSVHIKLVDVFGTRIAGNTPISVDIVDGVGFGAALVDTDLSAREAGTQLMAVDGELELTLMSPSRAGSITLQARTGSISADLTLSYQPTLRNWIVAGGFESNIDHYLQRIGELADTQEHHYFTDRIESLNRLSSNGNFRVAMRGSVFAKGTVKDDYLVTLIADTDKHKDDDWSGRLDLRRDYPRYGDASKSGAEGEAEKGLYLQIEHDDSFLLIGDFRPGQDNRRTRVGAYNRKFYGIQHHLEHKRWQIDTFAAQPSSNHVVDFIRARGTSGPFSLSKQNLIVNSEAVEVITRTRATDGEIISIETLNAFIDYELDPVQGTLILRAPLTGTDSEGRPRYLRITYNVDNDNQQYFDVAGTDISIRANDNLTLGLRTLLEQEDNQDYALSSINALYQLNNNSQLVTEIARSKRSGWSNNDRGDAANIRFEHQSSARDIRMNITDASKDFVNLSAASTAGAQSIDARWQEHLSQKLDLFAAIRKFSNIETGVESRGLEVGAIKRFSDSLMLGVQLDTPESENTTGEYYDDILIGINSQYRPEFLSDLTLDTRSYRSLETNRQRHRLSADYQLPRAGSFSLSWEYLNGYNVNSDLNKQNKRLELWSAGYKQQVHSTTQLYSEYRLENVSDGYRNSAATGLRYGYDIREGLRLVMQTERTKDLADTPENPARYSWALGLSGFDKGDNTWLARIEMLATQERRWLQEFRWAKYINDDWSILIKERMQWRGSFDDNAIHVTTGLAYRPREGDRWNWLGSIGLDKNLADAQNITPNIARITLRNMINLRPSMRWTATANFVAQHINDSSEYSYSSLAYLGRLRARYELSPTWSAGALGSYLTDARFDDGKNSWGIELQRSIGDSFFVGIRYQRFTYRNGGIDPDSVYRRGVSLNFGGIFDENSLAELLKVLE